MPANILDFGEGTLVLGATDHICQVMACRVVPSNTRQDVVTACGTKTRFINQRYDLVVQFAQDWHSAGISKYLWDHFNEDVAFTFSPADDNTPSMAGTVTCCEPTLGGDAGQPCIDQVVLPCVGRPTLTADA